MFFTAPDKVIPIVATGIEVADDQFEQSTERLTVYN